MTILRTLNGIFLVVTSLLCAVPAYAAFNDVPSDHPNAEAIAYVQTQGIVSGYPDGTYKPDQTINRAEFAKILEESIPDAENGVGVCPPDMNDYREFSDVRGHDWFGIYVCMQQGRGIVDGYSDKTFRPSTSINFVEAAKMFYGANHLDDRGILLQKVPSADPWFRPYVRYLEERNAIPTSITRFDRPITRGEMAEMIYRIHTQKESVCAVSPDLACARDAQRRADVQSIAGAIDNYYRRNSKMPIDIPESGLAICTRNAIEEGICTGPVVDFSHLVDGGFLVHIPVDPQMYGLGTKHTGYELFKHDDFIGVSALNGERIKNISSLIILPTLQ